MNAFNTTSLPVKLTTGYALARNGRSKSQRAALAAQIIAGEIELVDLTQGQIAKLVGVSRPYITAALELDPMRRRMMARGYLKVSEFQVPTDTALSRAIKAVGVEHAFDVMTADLT